MKTFLKILLIAVVLWALIKFSPVLFAAAVIGLLCAAVLGAVGLSLLAVVLGALLGVVVALTPIWLPVLAIIGLVSLLRKDPSATTPPAPPAPPALPPAMPVAS